VTRYERSAAYIRKSGGAGALARQRRTILDAAEARGWSEPAVYLDVDADPGSGPGLDRLAAAISTGRHDALILGGVGAICRSPADLMRLLQRCARNGVAVECLTGPGGARSGGSAVQRDGRGRVL
jgi:DNA invertase Pin-like site-specific DNA recombinase